MSTVETIQLRLEYERVALVGRFSATSRRQAQRLIRQHGGLPVPADDPSATLVVLGEESWAAAHRADADHDQSAHLHALGRNAAVISESQLWQRLGLVEDDIDVRRLYTPAMLAGLLGVPTARVRHWYLRGLLVPTRTVHRLPYFDFEQVTTARRLNEWQTNGIRPTSLGRQLAALARFAPNGTEADEALLQSVISDGRKLLIRSGGRLLDAVGQSWLDFDVSDEDLSGTTPDEIGAPPWTSLRSATIDELLEAVAQLDDEGRLDAAIEVCRAGLMAQGPKPELCFALAELLYRVGDLTAARERYAMAIELDEDYVEARANLGCVLAELGHAELAVAAFEGALAFHGGFPDVHYHLARTLDELGRPVEAAAHWQRFLDRAPQSPWADEARLRLQA